MNAFLDEGVALTRIVEDFNLGIEICNLALHLLRHWNKTILFYFRVQPAVSDKITFNVFPVMRTNEDATTTVTVSSTAMICCFAHLSRGHYSTLTNNKFR